MNISEKGLDIIRRFEGLELNAYRCPAGIWTIGYGHTRGVYPGMTITVEMANVFLRDDVRESERQVSRLVHVDLNQNQFDALVSFTFNLGADALAHSTLLRLLNAGAVSAASLEFSRWTKAKGKTLPGLVRRRQAERELFDS